MFIAAPVSTKAFDLLKPPTCNSSVPASEQVCTCQSKANNSGADAQVSTGPVCQDSTKNGNTNPVSGPHGLIQRAANILALATSVTAIIIIMISGLVYTTTGTGNADRAANARTTLIYAIIGLVITAMAWSIVAFVNQRIIKT